MFFFRYVFYYCWDGLVRRIYSYSNLVKDFFFSDKPLFYVLNLFGYYQTNFVRFIKLLFLYFFFRPVFDLFICLLFLGIELYMLIIEVIFNVLLDFRVVLLYFGHYVRLFNYLDRFYNRIVVRLFLILSFDKKLIVTIKKFSADKLFFNTVDFFFMTLYRILETLYYGKAARKLYINIKWLFFFLIYVAILLFVTFICLTIGFLYFYRFWWVLFVVFIKSNKLIFLKYVLKLILFSPFALILFLLKMLSNFFYFVFGKELKFVKISIIFNKFYRPFEFHFFFFFSILVKNLIKIWY